MTQYDPKLVDNIFSAALDLEGVERAEYVDRRCAGDEGLKARITNLIAAAEADENLLDSQLKGVRERMLETVLADGEEDSRDAEDLSGQRVGSWRLDKPIGTRWSGYCLPRASR